MPAFCWWIYIRIHLGNSFLSDKPFGLPLAGWKRTLIDSGVWAYSSDYYQFLFGESQLVVVIPMLALLAIAGLRALRFRTQIDLVYLLLGLPLVFLGWNSTYILRDSLRIVAVALVLVPFVIFSNREARQTGGRQPPVGPL